MKNKLLTCSIFAALLAVAHAEPAEELADAAKKLAAAKNYTWTSSTAWGEREPRVTTGKMGGGGHTHLSIPMRDSSIEVLIRKDKAAIKTDSGWQLASAEAEGEENRRLRWFARMATNFEAPTSRLEEVIEGIAELKAGEDSLTATLTEEAAKKLMAFRRGRRGGNDQEPPPIVDPSGIAKFLIKDGILSKYELTLNGKMAFNDQERDISRTTTVEFTKVGDTSFDISEEAAGLLAE